MTILKPVKEFTDKWIEKTKEEIKELKLEPKLAIVQVGDNPASDKYIKNKINDCNKVGITAHHYWFPEETTETDLIWEITELQKHYDGLIVQLPLPKHINPEVISQNILPEKDVDGFHPMSLFKPATPLGIMKYLKYCDFDVYGKDVVILGRSKTVGKPLAQMMTDADATVTLCHSKSRIGKHIYHCDLIISAVGKPKFLNCQLVDVPVIDVGINFDENGNMVGDCYHTKGKDVTPVPGGVGLLTRCALLANTVEAARLGREYGC
jgi:methylenetetrahydrofolate dehydrogenase (NADP+)/methenyltetrahydrofolate cyclohydrolase